MCEGAIELRMPDYSLVLIKARREAWSVGRVLDPMVKR